MRWQEGRGGQEGAMQQLVDAWVGGAVAHVFLHTAFHRPEILEPGEIM